MAWKGLYHTFMLILLTLKGIDINNNYLLIYILSVTNNGTLSPGGITRNRFGDQSLRVSNKRTSKHHQINHVRRRSFSEDKPN